MPKAICLSFVTFASLCDIKMVEWTLLTFAISPFDGEMMEWLKKVYIVTLFAFCLSSRSTYSVSAMTILTACRSFSLDNVALWRSLWPIRFLKIFVQHSSLGVFMHACSYDMSSLFKIFLPHPNTLKYIVTSYVTRDYSCSVSFFASFCLFITHYDSSSSVNFFWRWCLLIRIFHPP